MRKNSSVRGPEKEEGKEEAVSEFEEEEKAWEEIEEVTESMIPEGEKEEEEEEAAKEGEKGKEGQEEAKPEEEKKEERREREEIRGPLKASLLGDKVLVPEGLELYERSGFGDTVENGLEICPEEALYLLAKKRIEVFENETQLNFEQLLDRFGKLYIDIYIRYQVFKDLRDRGLTVRSGLKYGTHFRVYERGVKPKKGSRAPWEHAKYLVHAVSEGQVYTVPEMARFVRLSHSVKKKLWLAIVDGEGDVTYYQITRVTP